MKKIILLFIALGFMAAGCAESLVQKTGSTSVRGSVDTQGDSGASSTGVK